jgi:hypothetical protein
VVGRWKVTDVRVFRTECDWVPLSAAFLAALALTSWGLAAADDQLYVRGDGGAGRGGGLDTWTGHPRILTFLHNNLKFDVLIQHMSLPV